MGTVGFVAAFPFLYRQVDGQICRRFQSLVAQHYSGLQVTVRSAEFVSGEGIKLHDISIVEPSAEGPRADLLTIDELFLSTKAELKDLLVSDPVITHVTVRRPTLKATRRADGTWSSAKLYPPPKFGEHPPEVTVENGTIEIFDPTKSPCGTLPLREVNMTIHPATLTEPDGTTKEIRELTGMFACDFFRRFEFQGSVDPKTRAFSLKGTTHGLEISPELRDALPMPLCSKVHSWGGLKAEGKFDFEIAYDDDRPTPLLFHVEGSIEQGQIDDPHLPHPLSDVKATFRADNLGFIIDDLKAQCGQASVHLFDCSCAGYEAESPKSFKAEIRQLELEPALCAVLPAKLQEQWDIYRPAGKIDVEVRKLEFDGDQWHPDVTLSSKDVSFTHLKTQKNQKKFDYRFERGSGTMTLKENVLSLDMTAMGGNQPIRLRAEITNPTSGPTFWFESQGAAFPLDEKLFQALDDKQQNVVRSLEPRGTVNFYYCASCDVPGQPIHQQLTLRLNHCSIRFHKFPYPISEICGNLVMIDDQWDFNDLEGINNNAKITGKGKFRPTMEGNRLDLHLEGKNVSLEQELCNALPMNIRAIWRDMKPAGTVDLSTDIAYVAEKKQLSVAVNAKPLKDTTSIEPAYFPYRMEKVQGEMFYRDGHVILKGIRGWHGNVELGAEGVCDFHPAGPWEMHFKDLYINGLDRDLIQALPERLRKAVLALNPGRPANSSKSLANVRGDLDFAHNGIAGTPLETQWDMAVNLFQNEIQCGVKLENLCGNVMLKGRSDGVRTLCRGELALDSANFKEYQFTNVTGPIWIDNDRVLLGNWVDDPATPTPPPPASPPVAPRPITANLFDGVVHGKGWIQLGAEPNYGIEAALRQANLAKVIPGRQNMQGKIDAGIGLIGNGSSRNGMMGAGNIQVSDAYVYELPAMMQLIKLLRLRAPDRNAFSTVEVGYRIEGEHIYFDKIHFNGDAINLHGTGDMDWQSNLNVNLAAGFTKNDSRIPLIGPMISDTSRGAMLIRVRGTLQNPTIDKEALPGMNQAIQQLQERRK